MKILLLVFVQCSIVLFVEGICRNDCESQRLFYEAIPCEPSPKCHGGICARSYKCPYIDNWPQGGCYYSKTYYQTGDTFSINYYDKTTKAMKSCNHMCYAVSAWIYIFPTTCPQTDIADFNLANSVCTDNVRYDQQFMHNYNLPIYVSSNTSCPLSWLSAYFALPSNALNVTDRTCRAGWNIYLKGTVMLIPHNVFLFQCTCKCGPYMYCIYLA